MTPSTFAELRTKQIAVSMGAVFPPAPLTATARRVGFVDATADRSKPVARSLDEAFGPGARNTVVVPMDADEFDETDALVMRWSLRCAAVLVVIFAAEWFLL